CASPLRFMTHFANAHRRGDLSIERQLAVFEQTIGELPGERSVANSGAIAGLAVQQGDWVRPGLMLYGVSPLDGETAASLDLRPVMTLRSRLIAVRRVPRGDAVGYGGAFVCPEDMPVGV